MATEHEVGAYEAKTHLPQLLRRVAAGESITITQRGKPVASLVPFRRAGDLHAAGAARRMQSFMDRRQDSTPVDIGSLIDEGRD